MLNPFKEGSTQYLDFETLKDLNWHCSKCELKSGQAKTWQVWRQEKGIQLDTDEKGNWYKIQLCNNCNQNTVHRKLKSLEINKTDLKTRTTIPQALSKKIKKHYNYIDEYSMRREPENKLEIDHREPQVRWLKQEDVNNPSMSELEIEKKFMLLTRENNLLKSRMCENCVKTGKRAKGYKEIDFWYKGDEEFNVELKCEGCFWNNPSQWRKELNDFIKRHEDKI